MKHFVDSHRAGEIATLEKGSLEHGISVESTLAGHLWVV